jgi:hypothetical protein
MADKMEMFTTVYTRDYLRDLPAKRRREAIAAAVTSLQSKVVEAATCGKTFHLVDLTQYDKMRNGAASQHPPPYIPTNDDLIEGFRNKFPGCRVEYTETWEDVCPGLRQHKKGILIDWS